ncbi:MAG: PepSY-associated TM helix domain-containing protein [Rhodothermales bacterium]
MANLNRTTRKVHYWIGAAILLPVLVVTVSGLLLQVKKQSSWIQPDEHRGTGTVPEVTLSEVLTLLQGMPELGVTSWDDVDRLDVRPGKGMTKIRLNSGYEVQVDMGTGEVLQVAYRRTDLIEALHDGSWFGGDWTKLGLFLPSGVGLLVLALSGLWLFILPFRSRRRKRACGR